MAECPHPAKHRHVSKAAALAALTSLEKARGIDLTIRAYPCGDHWHLGHPSKPKKVALRQALAVGSATSARARRRRRRR
ncbi:hypothetical protein KVF89_22465 [Nocardioides carbamazepini]|uniref:hypothetical protein n=1 Tax=Nocardioides carbamazepini TaxID=2854259 RepID=UPI002149FD98|nr:hypothetical protein [Nocardioides carbamazepini]MCR1785321.1 hypothetical protein [Nocardioides carbamazepini]